MSDLKPCPFKHEGAQQPVVVIVWEITEAELTGSARLYHAECSFCSAQGPLEKTPEEAAESWNTRRPSSE